MINSMIEKLLQSKLKNIKCNFTEEERYFLENDWKINSNYDGQEEKLGLLILNTENDLPKKWITNIRRTYSLINLDIHSKLEDDNIFLKSFATIESEKMGDFISTFQQTPVVNALKCGKTISLVAGTGFGKTTIFFRYFIYKKAKFNIKKKFVICVPTELLEEQVIQKIKKASSLEKIRIGNDVYHDDILVCTPEKVEWLLKYEFNSIEEILFDEAHNLLNKDDHRSLYAMYIFNKVKETTAKIHIASPFIKKEEYDKFDYKFDNFFSINTTKNSNKTLLMEGEDGFKEIYDEFNISNTNKTIEGITLHYHPSVEKVRTMAENEINRRDPEHAGRLLKSINSKEIAEYREFFSQNYKLDKYLGLNSLRRGVAYFHGSMPTKIKAFILWTIENGFVDKVFATHSILNGIDLPFDNVVIEEIKIFRRKMNISDFNNLTGRAGRWTKEKRSTNYGITIIKSKESNLKWIRENKDRIKANKEMPFIENEEIYFTTESLDQYEKEKDEKFKIDVRVDPITTIKCAAEKIESHNSIMDVLFYSPFNKQEMENLVKEIFSFYDLNKYDSKYRKNTDNGITNNKKPKSKYNDMIISATLSFLKYGTVEKSMNTYTKSPNMVQETNAMKWTKAFEERMSRVKIYGKHYFSMFINHYIELNFTNGNLHKFKAYKTFSLELINIIQKNNLDNPWGEVVDLETRRFDKNFKTLETTIKHICSWRKTKQEKYSDIYNFFKNLKGNTKLK